MSDKISSYATAQLLVINASLYAEEKAKEISRYRFSRETLRAISGWGRLSESFLADLSGDLLIFGWIFFEVSDSECAIIQASKTMVWPKLSSKRLRTDDVLWTTDENEIEKTYKKRFPDSDTTSEVDA